MRNTQSCKSCSKAKVFIIIVIVSVWIAWLGIVKLCLDILAKYVTKLFLAFCSFSRMQWCFFCLFQYVYIIKHSAKCMKVQWLVWSASIEIGTISNFWRIWSNFTSQWKSEFIWLRPCSCTIWLLWSYWCVLFIILTVGCYNHQKSTVLLCLCSWFSWQLA